MDTSNKKKIYIVNGFLGAGKTTFMLNMIKLFSDKKVAVIVNEFGQQGMDGLILKRDGLFIEEINNGSIFCSCRSEDFVQALVEISQTDVDVVLVESSGLSDPTDLGKIMSLVQGLSKECYDYKGAIAIVNAENFEKLLYSCVAVELQIISTDYILINKIDLVSKDKLDSIEEKLRQLNPKAVISRASYGRIKHPEAIINLNNINSLQDLNIGKKRIIGTQKILLSMEGNFVLNDVEKWIREFAHTFYRIKGFAVLDGKWHFIDGTSERLEIKPSNIIAKEPSLVILASGDQPVKRAMISSWNKYFDKDIVII